MLTLIEGLPPTCDTWVALGADPWTTSEHLLRRIANSTGVTEAITFNVNRDREKVPEARTFDPIPMPERIRTPEHQAADEARQLTEQHRQALEEQSSMITHDIGTQLFSGQLTMRELSERIQAAGGWN